MNDNFYNNLVILLRLFKNRPYHLAKYLIDNSALNENFIQKISNSKKLIKINDQDVLNNFKNISEMEDFYQSLIDELSDNKEIEENINEELDTLIEQEKYEEAARLRDYMNKNRIRRK